MDLLFDKFDYDLDDELSILDWHELTGETGRDKMIGRKLILLPSPIFKSFTRLDTNRNDGLSLEEVQTFMKRLFKIVDKNEDCFVDLDEIISVLDENQLPKDFQLAVKQLAKQQLTIANHVFNRILDIADADSDGETDLEELLEMPNYDFLESEANDILLLAKPQKELLGYLPRKSTIQNIVNTKENLLEIQEGQTLTLKCDLFPGEKIFKTRAPNKN